MIFQSCQKTFVWSKGLIYVSVTEMSPLPTILDLRQDMLTLQLIRVMEAIWKNAGLDLR